MPARAAAEESIFDLIPAPPSSTRKVPLYHSRHPHSTPPTASTFGASIATATLITNSGGDYSNPAKVHQHIKAFAQFGPKTSHTANPTSFISAHSQHPPLPSPSRAPYTDRRKPALDTQPIPLTSKPSRNFIAENTSKAVASQPPVQGEGEVRYVTKAEYGRVPGYLEEVKAAVGEEKEMVERMLRPQVQARAEMLGEEERVELVTGLKGRWECLMRDYQVLTHMSSHTLSMGNLKRKEELERKLSDTEKAIKKLDKTFVLITQQ